MNAGARIVLADLDEDAARAAAGDLAGEGFAAMGTLGAGLTA